MGGRRLKKILITASTLGHLKSFHLPYLEALQKEGFQVDIACPVQTEVEKPKGVHEVIHVPFQKKMFAPSNLKATGMLVKKMNHYDILITHTALASFFSRLALFFTRKKPHVICMVHGYLFHAHSSSLKTLLLRSAEKLVAHKTDVVLCMNQWDLQQAEKYKLGKKIGFVSGIGVSFTPITEKDTIGLRESLSLPQDCFLLAFGGEFSHRKNQMFLIKAMTKLPQQVHLALAGRGDTLEDCKAFVAQLGLEHRVHFLGFVSPLTAWYQVADCVVTACVSEGLPVHLMEALFLGKPVVVSDVKGNQDLVVEGETGLLFPWNHEDAYVSQIKKLLENPNVGKTMGGKGKNRMNPYDLEHVLPEVMDWYCGS